MAEVDMTSALDAVRTGWASRQQYQRPSQGHFVISQKFKPTPTRTVLLVG